MINKAMSFAEKAHRGQTRKYSDTAYFIHPVRVFYKLLLYNFDNENALCAALLHDTVEDCNVTFEEIQKEFNSQIAILVEELTQADKLIPELKGRPRVERHQANLEKLKNISCIAKTIKLCDRWDNLEDVNLFNKKCYGFLKKRYLQESWDILKVLDASSWLIHNKLKKVIEDLAQQIGVDLI